VCGGPNGRISFSKNACEHGVVFSLCIPQVKAGLNFLLEHFDQNFLFPRNIATRATNGGQRCVFSKEAALFSYKQADFFDCRINAYPNQKYLKRIRQKPDFLFLDIDGRES
jgi:hypothetical protein